MKKQNKQVAKKMVHKNSIMHMEVTGMTEIKDSKEVGRLKEEIIDIINSINSEKVLRMLLVHIRKVRKMIVG